MLLGDLASPAKRHDIDKTNILPRLPVFSALLNREGEFTHRQSPGRVAEFRVPGEVSDQDNLVIPSHLILDLLGESSRR
jgi:hypothetical protein